MDYLLIVELKTGADPDISFGGHEAPKAPRSSAAGTRIEAPSGVGYGEGYPPPTGEGLCHLKTACFGGDSDVLNVPVTHSCRSE